MDIELPRTKEISNDIENYLTNYSLTHNYHRVDVFAKHESLYKLSKIQLYISEQEIDLDLPWGQRSQIEKLYATIALLCDQYTQPSATGETNEFVLSLHFISNIVIALNTSDYFQICLLLAKIIERITILLNCFDEFQIPSIDDINNETLLLNLSTWTPQKILYQSQLSTACHDLNLLYSIVSVSFYTIGNIYKNYLHQENPGLNPFLFFLLKYWKIQTHIVILGLEFDRNCENNFYEYASPQYPEIIRYTIRGSLTIRNVLAIILNDDHDVRFHDTKHESFLNFTSPWGRKAGNGALTCDMRLYVSSMLSLGNDLLDVTSLLINLEPDDKYDEDINYVFDYELDEDEAGEGDENAIDVYQDESGKIIEINDKRNVVYDVHPDCKCGFDEYPVEEEEEAEYLENDDRILYKFITEDGGEITYYEKDGEVYNSKTNELINQDELLIRTNPIMNRSHQPKLIRNNDENFIDEEGNDWRDIPRGDNVNYTDFFLKKLVNKKNFYQNWDEVENELNKLGNEVISLKDGEKLILTICKVIKDENGLNSNISPDLIYKKISSDYTFEKMVNLNAKLSFQIIDEMMMCHGFRRVLIWFLTHLELSHSLIQYIHDLILEQRDLVSRCGKLTLSKIEKMMLIHEFLSNSTVYLSRGTSLRGDTDEFKTATATNYKYIATPQESKKLIKIICQLLKSLFEKGILVANDKEFRNELQTLLLQWVCISDDAKEIYDKC